LCVSGMQHVLSESVLKQAINQLNLQILMVYILSNYVGLKIKSE